MSPQPSKSSELAKGRCLDAAFTWYGRVWGICFDFKRLLKLSEAYHISEKLYWRQYWGFVPRLTDIVRKQKFGYHFHPTWDFSVFRTLLNATKYLWFRLKHGNSLSLILQIETGNRNNAVNKISSVANVTSSVSCRIQIAADYTLNTDRPRLELVLALIAILDFFILY